MYNHLVKSGGTSIKLQLMQSSAEEHSRRPGKGRYYLRAFPPIFSHILFPRKTRKNRNYFHIFGNLTDGKISGKLNFQNMENKPPEKSENKKQLRGNKTWKIWKFRTKRFSIITTLVVSRRCRLSDLPYVVVGRIVECGIAAFSQRPADLQA